MTKQSGNWDRKSEEWLLSALKSESEEDVNQAIETLRQQFGPQIRRAVRAKVPSDWVDDVVQDVWIGFYQRVVSGQVKIQTSIGPYLSGITRYKIADAAEQLNHENIIECDLDDELERDASKLWDGVDASEAEDTYQRQEELVIARTQMAFVELVPYVDKVLSDCQRVLWSLVRMHEMAEKDVSRLLGKKYSTIRSQYRHSRNKLVKYFQGQDFEALLQTGQLPKRLQFHPYREASVVVERFAEMTAPEFTEDELKPLGLAPKEFIENYTASIITPRWFSDEKQLEINRPSILLTRKDQWSDLNLHLQRLYRDLKDTRYTPLECLIDFTIDDGNFILQPASLVEMIPDMYPEGMSENAYIAAHQPRMVKPVTWGFWDPSMEEDEHAQAEYEHWPFMSGVGDWIDLRG